MSGERNHQALLASAAAGDDAALAVLVRLHHDRVYRFGRRVCRDEFDAEDAVQEAFSKLARRPDVQRHPGALSWLLSVVRNGCRRLLRPLARQRRLLGEEAADEVQADEPDAESALARWQLVSAVHQAIARLELPYREVLVLRDLEGLSGDETCAALGLKPEAMKTRLHRARSKLRAMLKPAGADQHLQ